MLFCSITFNTTARKRHHVKLVLFYLTTDTSHFDDCQDGGRSFISKKLTKQKKNTKTRDYYLCCVKYTHDTNKPITYSCIIPSSCIITNKKNTKQYYQVYLQSVLSFLLLLYCIQIHE